MGRRVGRTRRTACALGLAVVLAAGTAVSGCGSKDEPTKAAESSGVSDESGAGESTAAAEGGADSTTAAGDVAGGDAAAADPAAVGDGAAVDPAAGGDAAAADPAAGGNAAAAVDPAAGADAASADPAAGGDAAAVDPAAGTDAAADPAAEAAAVARSIEQVYVNMPEVTVYGYGLLDGGVTPEAYLGEEKLTYESGSAFADAGEGIDYSILLDVSNSMPNGYFTSLKSGIAQFAAALSPEDTATLITFGEEVTTQADLKGDPAQLAQVLASIRNTDNRTMLFEAVSSAAARPENDDGQAQRRKVLAVISDGEDVAVGKKVAAEALEELKKDGVPVYALCIRSTALVNINSFGEFARSSGGDIDVFDQSGAEGALLRLKDKLAGAQELTFTAATNKASNSYMPFSLRYPDGAGSVDRQVMVDRWVADTTAPELLSFEQVEGRQLRVAFSEPVAGAETAANYLLKQGERTVPIAAVAADESTPNTYILTAGEALKGGTYTLSCPGTTDQSQEANKVSNTREAKLKSSDAPSMVTIIIGVIVALLVIAGIVMAARYSKKKKLEAGKIIYVDGKEVETSGVEVKHHVEIKEASEMPFDLTVAVKGRKPKKFSFTIDKSLIVGRSDICDIFFDDKNMSRQHFALEWDGESMYITDLETTNGTMINGVRITGRRKLERGDRITAGAEDMTINW